MCGVAWLMCWTTEVRFLPNDSDWVALYCRTVGREVAWKCIRNGVHFRQLRLSVWLCIGGTAITCVVILPALLAWSSVVCKFRWFHLQGGWTGEGEWSSSRYTGSDCKERGWGLGFSVFAASTRECRDFISIGRFISNKMVAALWGVVGQEVEQSKYEKDWLYGLFKGIEFEDRQETAGCKWIRQCSLSSG